MSLSTSAKYALPRPVRDVAHQIYYGIKHKTFYKHHAARLATRVAVAAGLFFAVRQCQCHPLAAGFLGSVLSLPVTLLAVGGKALFEGAKMIREDLSTRAFKEIGKGFALATAGYLTLEKHNAIRFGLLENKLALQPPKFKY